MSGEEENCCPNVKISNNESENVTQKQSVLCVPTKYSFSVTDTPGMNFENKLSIQLTSNKPLKICIAISLLLNTFCILWLSFITYKLKTDLYKTQDQANNTVDSVHMTVVDSGDQMKLVMRDDYDETTDMWYDYDTENLPDVNLNRSPRANKRRKQCCRQKRTEPMAMHFKGNVPEVLVQNEGLIGPWQPDYNFVGNYKFQRFHLTERKYSIEVTESALYLIYAQVYYVSSKSVNSYSICVRSEGSSQNSVIARCSASGPNNSHTSELSCYTSTVYNLKVNDRVYIQQTERNRSIILRDGHSFFGIVRLNNLRNRKK